VSQWVNRRRHRCLIFCLTFSLTRVLASSHQVNPWLFGCLCCLSLASPRVCLAFWFVLIQSPTLRIGKVTPFRRTCGGHPRLAAAHGRASTAARTQPVCTPGLSYTMMSSRRGSCSSADSSPDDDLFRHVRAGQSPGQAQAGLHSRRRLVMDLTARENMDYFRKQEHGYKSSGHLRAPTRTGFPAILRACGRWGNNLRRRDAEGDSS
jgi:hypothetical protein